MALGRAEATLLCGRKCLPSPATWSNICSLKCAREAFHASPVGPVVVERVVGICFIWRWYRRHRGRHPLPGLLRRRPPSRHTVLASQRPPRRRLCARWSTWVEMARFAVPSARAPDIAHGLLADAVCFCNRNTRLSDLRLLYDRSKSEDGFCLVASEDRAWLGDMDFL